MFIEGDSNMGDVISFQYGNKKEEEEERRREK